MYQARNNYCLYGGQRMNCVFSKYIKADAGMPPPPAALAAAHSNSQLKSI